MTLVPGISTKSFLKVFFFVCVCGGGVSFKILHFKKQTFYLGLFLIEYLLYIYREFFLCILIICTPICSLWLFQGLPSAPHHPTHSHSLFFLFYNLLSPISAAFWNAGCPFWLHFVQVTVASASSREQWLHWVQKTVFPRTPSHLWLSPSPFSIHHNTPWALGWGGLAEISPLGLNTQYSLS